MSWISFASPAISRTLYAVVWACCCTAGGPCQSSLSACGLSCEILFCGFAVGCGGTSVRFPYSKLAGLSPRKAGFSPSPVHLGFVVDNVALGQGLFRILRIFPISIILLVPRTHSFICHQRYVILATDTVIKYKMSKTSSNVRGIKISKFSMSATGFVFIARKFKDNSLLLLLLLILPVRVCTRRHTLVS